MSSRLADHRGIARHLSSFIPLHSFQFLRFNNKAPVNSSAEKCQVHYVISETVVFTGFEEDQNKRIIRILYRGQSSSDYSLLVVPRGVNVSRFA